ncbi:M23 family metallopeptidase [Microbacterium sp. W1N]|uniref:M23 family metallopeptidase n=1 Tax=Microbacterium festucae TaxID=2977531 RepID=UPI0021BEE8E1|nr:M23 family metallopeptidase [Microbacterium festucae]MCT9820820.1 M23 family metallopeptidase [Microbacterium festucae]
MTRAQWRLLQASAAAGAAETEVVASAPAAAPQPTVIEFVDEQAAEEAIEPSHQASIAEAILAEAAIIAEATVIAGPPAAARRRDRRTAAPVVSVTGEGVATADAGAVGIPATFAAAPSASSGHDDEFERVARLFSFTGQTPVQTPASRASEAVFAEPRPAAAPAPAASRRRISRRDLTARIAAGSFSIGAMAIVGLLAIGTTSPAIAAAVSSDATSDISLAATTATASTTKQTKDIQAFVSAPGTDVTIERSDTYDVASMADVAADSGVTIFAGTWVNDPTAEVQWPFPVGVPISAAYGSQSYLSKFSSPHRGVDLTPGLGAEVHAIAAGTVRLATEAGGDYGVTVIIDHVIDGQMVSSRYAHMLRGSLDVKQGDTVTAGQVLGKVGQTGKATGPHLHLEVLLGGTANTDPMAWLEEHTSR